MILMPARSNMQRSRLIRNVRIDERELMLRDWANVIEPQSRRPDIAPHSTIYREPYGESSDDSSEEEEEYSGVQHRRRGDNLGSGEVRSEGRRPKLKQMSASDARERYASQYPAGQTPISPWRSFTGVRAFLSSGHGRRHGSRTAD